MNLLFCIYSGLWTKCSSSRSVLKANAVCLTLLVCGVSVAATLLSPLPGEDDEVQRASGSWLQFCAETVRWGEIDIEFELTLNTRGPHRTFILPWLC